MWIIPENLELSSGVLDMLEYPKDSEELSRICESSLMHRGKMSKAKTWEQRLKKEPYKKLIGRVAK